MATRSVKPALSRCRLSRIFSKRTRASSRWILCASEIATSRFLKRY